MGSLYRTACRMALVAVLAAATLGAAACKSSVDCSMAGTCGADGTCTCVGGFHGTTCAELKLASYKCGSGGLCVANGAQCGVHM